jgi:hypothetical protein
MVAVEIGSRFTQGEASAIVSNSPPASAVQPRKPIRGPYAGVEPEGGAVRAAGIIAIGIPAPAAAIEEPERRIPRRGGRSDLDAERKRRGR